MVRLNYSVMIDSPTEHVWKTMLDPGSYLEWARAFSPNSTYAGDWSEGSHMLFTDPNLGGTKAVLEKVVPLQLIRARHLAILSKEGIEDTQSDEARKWVGAIEEYRFRESNGKTTVDVAMTVHKDFVGMFNENWPEALNLLKNLCERKVQA
jgi:hypothetical protein